MILGGQRSFSWSLFLIGKRYETVPKFTNGLLSWLVEVIFFVLFVCLPELIPTMETLFPTVEHIYCVKHIYNNFKVNHKRLEPKDALWSCATTTTVREFERGMQYMKELDENV